MQNTSSKIEALREEISRMLFRGIIVVNRTQALELAESLNTAVMRNSFQRWHTAEFNAIDRETCITFFSLEDMEQVLDEILDFHDRIKAELISPYSIQVININAVYGMSVEGSYNTLALIGDWEPEIVVKIPRAREPYEFGIPEFEFGVQDLEKVAHYDLTEEGKALVYGDGQGDEGAETDETVRLQDATKGSGIQFLVNADKIDISAKADLLPFPQSDLFRNTMEGLSQPVSRWLPDEESLTQVKALRETLPHLSEFLDEVILAMDLAIRFKATRFTLPPMILNGPPGIGKTHGLFQLAETLGFSMESIPMATTDAGFVLTGCERGWKEPMPGLLAKSAAKCQHINPIFILDEFEKSNFRRDYGVNGTESAVLQMLERDSAARFRDGFLEHEINLSEVSYIGSSNSVDQIPAPILSRVKVIEVGFPPTEALQGIYTAILNKALKDDFGVEGITVMVAGDICEAARMGITPRAIRNNAGKILSAALNDKKEGDGIEISGKALMALMKRSSVNKKGTGMGFLAQL